MRTLTPDAAAAIAARDVAAALMVDMLLTLPLRLVSGTHPVVYAGNTYQPTGALGSIETVDDSPGELKPLRFKLSGVSNDTLAIALNEPIRNKRVAAYIALLRTSDRQVLGASRFWSGTLDQMPIELGTETSTITVTAQHRGATFARPKPLRYTDIDQQRLYPGDTALRFVESQANHLDIWPAASFSRI